MSAKVRKISPLPAFVFLMQFLGSHFAAAGTPEACSLLSTSEVARITGDESPILVNNVTAKGSVCIYSANRDGSTAASVTINILESASEAQKKLELVGDVNNYKTLLEPGDKIEPDRVAGMPAVFQIIHGSAYMHVVKGSLMITAAVNRVFSSGKKEPNRERSRSLLAAVLGKL